MPSTSLVQSVRPTWLILLGASVMLSLAMGLRQSLGLFMTPLTRDIGVSISEFTVAISVQNLAWGILQPIVGAWTVRLGYGRVMVVGSVLYLAGLVMLTLAQGFLSVLIGAGVLIGAALACTASAVALSVSARATPPAVRSAMLGIVSAAGSAGALISAPIGQLLIATGGWRLGVGGFALLATLMVPMAIMAGRVDRLPEEKTPARAGGEGGTAWEATRIALANPAFMIMTAAYFVCGMQLVFLTTHLPSYLALCGMDPMLSAEALATIGGFNILGSLFFGWAGGRWNKLALLGGIYVVRSAVLLLYFWFPPTPAGTLLFAALMGFTWLGVAPLVAGFVAETFGLRWQTMIQGIAFVSHQLGSFLGALGGGLVFDTFGSYDLAWRVGVAVGVTAGIVQIATALVRRPEPPLAAAT